MIFALLIMISPVVPYLLGHPFDSWYKLYVSSWLVVEFIAWTGLYKNTAFAVLGLVSLVVMLISVFGMIW